MCNTCVVEIPWGILMHTNSALPEEPHCWAHGCPASYWDPQNESNQSLILQGYWIIRAYPTCLREIGSPPMTQIKIKQFTCPQTLCSLQLVTVEAKQNCLLAYKRQNVWFQLWLLAFKLWWNQGISYPTWVSQRSSSFLRSSRWECAPWTPTRSTSPQIQDVCPNLNCGMMQNPMRLLLSKHNLSCQYVPQYSVLLFQM